jgi:hypothetical protein
MKSLLGDHRWLAACMWKTLGDPRPMSAAVQTAVLLVGGIVMAVDAVVLLGAIVPD